MATHHSHRLARLIAAGLFAAVLATPGAVARPGIDPQPSASVGGASATSQSITFTNPLHRSRGPGAGMGLL